MVLNLNNFNSDGRTIDDQLVSWQAIASQFNNCGILLGNGFSCAVWEKFGYSSLYEKACSDDIQKPLSLEDMLLFKSLKTKNFERVLSILTSTGRVNRIFGQDYQLFDQRYEHIKTALGEAVRAVHIPWLQVSEQVLTAIRRELKRYKSIYSTNYDLLTYWAVMSENNGDGFKDYFWKKIPGCDDPIFDVTDTSIRGNPTLVLYLHGALHLYREPESERTYKLVSRTNQSLLDIPEVPLFITEGSSSDKLRAINSSDYLSFAYQRFLGHSSPLVVFGHSLGETDGHLVKAIKASNADKIAISIRSSNSPDTIRQKKADLHQRLCDGRHLNQRPELFFFDAQTHPFGSSDIRIEDESELCLV